MTEAELAALLKRYSDGEMSAVELRRLMGRATFGDVLIALAAHDLPLPRASQEGRGERIEAARGALFPTAA